MLELLLIVFVVPGWFGLIERVKFHLLYCEEWFINFNVRFLSLYLWENKGSYGFNMIWFGQFIDFVCKVYIFLYLDGKSVDEGGVFARKSYALAFEVALELDETLGYILFLVFLWGYDFLYFLLEISLFFNNTLHQISVQFWFPWR